MVVSRTHLREAFEFTHMSTSLGGFWNELEPTLLIIVGFVLFVIPEPVSSTLGAGLMLLGVSWWFYEWER
jgi:hypothetical protein